MDLKKLDPMARKMRVHIDAFYKAIEDNDGSNAGSHINEILKYAEYMSKDVGTIIAKADFSPSGINDRYAGGAPVRKFNQTEKVHVSSNDVLPGTIRTNRIGSIMRQQSNRTI
tara:strand:+ start:3350 stop:3688 length:339 start_codon:yes stop_codon:yes gene_type:complete